MIKLITPTTKDPMVIPITHGESTTNKYTIRQINAIIANTMPARKNIVYEVNYKTHRQKNTSLRQIEI